MPDNGLTIDGLNSVSAITANDEIPVWDAEAAPNEPTKKITGSNLASSIKTLGSLLGMSDVVNSLTSTSTTAPLSANMGKTLNDKIISLVTKYTYVGTTDTDGDIPILNATTGRVLVSAIPNRSYGDGTYSSWFGVIVGQGISGQISVKCVNDNNQKLGSQKVAIDVYFIEGQQLG